MNDLQGIHIDTYLTGISIRQANDPNDYVGNMALPTVTVDKRTDLYYIHGLEHFKRIDAVRAPGSIAKEVFRTRSKGNYVAAENALQEFVPSEMNQEADTPPVAPMEEATVGLTDQLLLMREIAQLGAVSDTSVITNQLVQSGATLWSAYDTSTPLKDIITAKKAIRAAVKRNPNFFTIQADVDDTLADHPTIKELRKYTDSNVLTESGLPPVIRGLRVVLSTSYVDNAPLSAATTQFAPVFSKTGLVHYTDPAPGLRKLSLGYTFQAPNADSGQSGLQVKSWKDENRTGWYVRVMNTWATKVVAPGAGYLFPSAIA